MNMGKKKRKAKIRLHQQDIDCHLTKQLVCGCLKVWIYDRGYFKAAGYEERCNKHIEKETKEWLG